MENGRNLSAARTTLTSRITTGRTLISSGEEMKRLGTNRRRTRRRKFSPSWTASKWASALSRKVLRPRCVTNLQLLKCSAKGFVFALYYGYHIRGFCQTLSLYGFVNGLLSPLILLFAATILGRRTAWYRWWRHSEMRFRLFHRYTTFRDALGGRTATRELFWGILHIQKFFGLTRL